MQLNFRNPISKKNQGLIKKNVLLLKSVGVVEIFFEKNVIVPMGTTKPSKEYQIVSFLRFGDE